MKITVKLFATLRRDRFDISDIEYGDGDTVLRVLESLSISPEEAPIIFINGRHAMPDSALKDGDTLAVFPPIGGG